MSSIKILVVFVLFLPFIWTQVWLENYIDDIYDLFVNISSYEYPEYYEDFYQSEFIEGGDYGEFDFIIIGAGSAGTVLANRLSENPKWKILLLEAGQDDTLYTDIPAMAGLLQFGRFNWGYRSTPQKNSCLGMEDRRCNIPRGKGLGGSSSINFMMYTRGSKADYDNWAKDGNPGWSYKEVLPYFIKSENSSLRNNVDWKYHNKKGTLGVEHVRHFTDFAKTYLKANEELGRKILDYNGESEIGFSRLQSTTLEGRRCSGNKAFLSKAVGRKNLTVQKGAFVTRLLLNDGVVFGVEFVLGNKKYNVTSRKEVVLSAGAIGSPQILMLSGIGPKQELEALGIEVFQDLAVGKNLGDHPFFYYAVLANYTDPAFLPLDEMIIQYVNGKGFLTTAGSIQAIGYINTVDPISQDPDIEQFVSPLFNFQDGFISKGFGIKEEIFQPFFRSLPESSPFMVSVLLHPKSRGSITLKSKNPFDHPLIDLNYFDDPDDVEVLVNGMKDNFKIVGTRAMKRFNSKLPHNPVPQCPGKYLSDDYLRCLVRHLATTLYHQSGTCKMGPETDPEAVVDSRLRVKGVQNLRVIDASVIPFPLAAHTNAPTFMIAEKGSDLIKEDHLFSE